jgi:hypothetical protein
MSIGTEYVGAIVALSEPIGDTVMFGVRETVAVGETAVSSCVGSCGVAAVTVAVWSPTTVGCTTLGTLQANIARTRLIPASDLRFKAIKKLI